MNPVHFSGINLARLESTYRYGTWTHAWSWN